MQKYLVAGALAFCCVSAVHAANSTPNPDVKEAFVYRCVRGDHSVFYTNVEGGRSQTCTRLIELAMPAPGRPGLSTYRVLSYNSDPVLLYSTERLDLASNPRSAWLMLSFMHPMRYGAHGQLYTRTVAKFTVDCIHSIIEATSGYDYAVEGGRTVLVGSEPAWPSEEPAPETVADSIMKNLCGLKK